MIVTLSGLPGSGKTSVARELIDRYGFTMISAGEQFRRLAQERGMTLEEFGALAQKESSIDIAIDRRQKELAQKCDMALVEGRLAGHTIEADLKIWLKTTPQVRARRVAKREGISIEKALADNEARELVESTRYKKFYNIDQHDWSCYDLIIDTRLWDAKGVADIISMAIDGLKNNGA
ncbi:MAG TPA: AAA family ATPase [Methanocella sp.]|uniref:(d)CMP kinase n=1 Tax=Methanocella sp. TaxID=2052833 RepID=UPI002C33BA5A|nr:AAA family ATPase [Methanocella sp.]HTY91116.1 AAA family ATPase [Methanocella sp.]